MWRPFIKGDKLVARSWKSRYKMADVADVFRVVRIADRREIHRSVDLEGASAFWVKDPHNLRVEQLPAGSTAPTREVCPVECCETLDRWFRQNKHLSLGGERSDLEQLIREACFDFRPTFD
jgi:hypothetical protein